MTTQEDHAKRDEVRAKMLQDKLDREAEELERRNEESRLKANQLTAEENY